MGAANQRHLEREARDQPAFFKWKTALTREKGFGPGAEFDPKNTGPLAPFVFVGILVPGFLQTIGICQSFRHLDATQKLTAKSS